MDDVPLDLHRVGDRNLAAIAQDECAGIARLSSATRVEHRTIEADAVVVDSGGPGCVFALVGRVAVERFGHGYWYYGALRKPFKINTFPEEKIPCTPPARFAPPPSPSPSPLPSSPLPPRPRRCASR